MFTSWQVRCGIANYASLLVDALNKLDDTQVTVVPFDRQAHPRSDYEAWGRQLNAADVAHIQHEYTFFGYLAPWKTTLVHWSHRSKTRLSSPDTFRLTGH